MNIQDMPQEVILVVVENDTMWDDFISHLHAKAKRINREGFIDGDYFYKKVFNNKKSEIDHLSGNHMVVQVQRYMCSFSDNQTAAFVLDRMRHSSHPHPCIYVEAV